jgi:deleted-in-malignant-brain-tumors protein 1
LVGGRDSLEGRVEMCYSGVWGTVCSDLWGAADAAVVCRQLGYSSSGHKLHTPMRACNPHYLPNAGATARINGAFGQGNGPILWDDVRCSGLEQRLFDCVHNGLEVHNCDHHQDAGVVCVVGRCI